MVKKEFDKDGGNISYGYKLTCNEGLAIKATVEKTYDQSDWITVTGADGNTKEGTIEINVSANPGNPRTANVYLDIIGGSSGPNRCTDKFIFIDQAGEGGGGSTSCSYNISHTTPTCGEEFTVTWTKTEPTPPGPTPPGPTPPGTITVTASPSSVSCGSNTEITLTAIVPKKVTVTANPSSVSCGSDTEITLTATVS